MTRRGCGHLVILLLLNLTHHFVSFCGLVLVCSVIETYENPEVCAVAVTFKNQVKTY